MADPEDQHQILLFGISESGARDAPVVIAFHGQPGRGQAPRTYGFAKRVIGAARATVEAGGVQPFVLVLPVFRYAGVDWPSFDLVEFQSELGIRLGALHVTPGRVYVLGHSGAAGCGGDGLNRAHRVHPAGVAFIDTCVGAGWRSEVRALRATRTPTLIIHSVETAGFVPRQPHEYLTDFDFGKVDGPVGLAPTACPDRVPAAALRKQAYRCSADADGIARGFVIDSGAGETGHNAAVGSAVRYFLEEYVGRAR